MRARPHLTRLGVAASISSALSCSVVARVALGALALAASCREPTAPGREPSAVALELAGAMERWAVAAPAAYEVTVRPSCFCDPDALRSVIVRVRGNTVESRRFADTGDEVPNTRFWAYPTVTELFAFIGDADASGAARVVAVYDAAYGYPVSAYVDQDERIADEELGFLMSNFHPIP